LGTLEQGARNAVEVCTSVTRGEHVLILTDRRTIEVGRAIEKAAERVTKENVKLFVLEDYTDRPATELPEIITKEIPWANVTFLSLESERGELAMRMLFVRTALKYARHAHMPGITRELMESGMCADYMRISELTKKVECIVKNARRARVVNPRGTELEVEFHPSWRWVIDDGLLHKKGMYGNLPAGEIFTAAYRVNGRIVVDELGDWFTPRYGYLKDTPVTLMVRDSRADLSSISCENESLRKELVEYLSTDSNSSRLGEFAIGTNLSLTSLKGNMLQDEKFPSVHCAFGDPLRNETGADWESKTHIDGLILKASIWIDDRKIMNEGKHLIE
jgi:leucyl aminopeptidase (aminopeptidase T)